MLAAPPTSMSQGTSIQTLPGFREFYPVECATRNYLFDVWRRVCRGYGFHEYEGPTLESTDLYRKKSGDEVVEQLFAFTDKGDREVAMRPELTPTLARMIAARQRDFKKPMRWFGIGPFFRFERPQIAKGRLREFYQFNCDIIGEESENADAELISFAIDVMLELGFDQDDFVVRLSDREAWLGFMKEAGLAEEHTGEFLQCIDKMEREKPEITQEKLGALGTSLDAVQGFVKEGAASVPRLARLLESLMAQGKDEYCQVDLGIVRGLAYYTGTVFEIFDKKHGLRAIAGGGRYDDLIAQLSDGKAKMPAAGFAMGDAVIGNLIAKGGEPNSRLTQYLDEAFAIDAYVVIASEKQRPAALAEVQRLRDAGLRVHFPYSAMKVGKQFQTAEAHQARIAVVIGDEYPTLKVKDLVTRDEKSLENPSDLIASVKDLLANEHPFGLLA